MAPRQDDSGWTELPPIRDMARLRIGNSTCQIEGQYVPVADFNLAAGDSVYFAHHVLLWQDPLVEIRRMPLAGSFRRLLSGLPVIMTEAHGPGHIAFSRDAAGELIALPLQPGQSVDVREHLFLAATSDVAYGWNQTGIWFTTGSGKDLETHFPVGQLMDRFGAGPKPGLLLLHAGGNAFVRTLAEDETILIKPTSLLYKDPSVHMALRVESVGYTALGQHRLVWLHLRGPGRVAVQSAYEHMEGDAGSITGTSPQWAGVVARNALPRRGPQPLGRPGQPLSRAQIHAELVRMISDALVAGQVPPIAMEKIFAFGALQGLSAYDVQMLVRQVKPRVY